MERRVSIRRVTSAGYRLPERPSVAPASQPSVSVKSEPLPPPPERDPDTWDPVKRERVWRELVRAERHAVKEW